MKKKQPIYLNTVKEMLKNKDYSLKDIFIKLRKEYPEQVKSIRKLKADINSHFDDICVDKEGNIVRVDNLLEDITSILN
ncbi:MAG: hypothetical protein ACOCP8_00070 [archaeon]